MQKINRRGKKKRFLKIKFNSAFKNPTDDLKNGIETAEKGNKDLEYQIKEYIRDEKQK